MSKLADIVAFSDIQVTARAKPYNGNPFDIEISSVSLTFTENGIPRAVLKIALGESPQPNGGVKTAKAHLYAQKLEQRDRITVTAKFKGHQVPEGEWDKGGEFELFEGYLSRPAYSMGTSAASLVLEVDHWLSDLATTDKLSYLSAASSTAHCTHPATTRSLSGALTAFDGTMNTYDSAAPDGVWQSIKRMFTLLANKDRMEVGKIVEMGINATELKTNALALGALNKMDNGLSMTMALQLDVGPVKSMFKQGLTTIVAARETGASYWETLLSLSRSYLFSVVPAIATASCVPVLKTATKVWRTIKASEYSQLQASGDTSSLPIRGLGLYSSSSWLTLDTSGFTKTTYDAKPKLIGYADIARESDSVYTAGGQIVTEYAPGWTFTPGGAFARATPRNTPGSKPLRSCWNAKKGEEAPEEDEVDPNKGPDGLGDRLAQARLSDLLWAQRRGAINGRLRFDIAPGSPIAVEIIGKNVPYYHDGSGNLYAHVYQVDITIDAVSQRASTTLRLSHMRTANEQKRFKSILTDTHPLYTNLWGGAGLLEGQ